MTTVTTKEKYPIKGTTAELQEKFAKWCGYKTFEELRRKDGEALKAWYLNMI